MGRWRPPVAKSSPYITPEGAQKLTDELKILWKIERPEVTAKVQAAAKNGDRSENGDYIYGKQRLREIDRRVRYLSNRLDEVTIVDRSPSDQNCVYFGAWVDLNFLSDGTRTIRVRVVGADEIDARKQWISMDSPLGKGLLGKAVGDKVVYKTESGENAVRIDAILYHLNK